MPTAISKHIHALWKSIYMGKQPKHSLMEGMKARCAPACSADPAIPSHMKTGRQSTALE